MLMDLNCKTIFLCSCFFYSPFSRFCLNIKKEKSCPRTTDSLFYNMQAVMMWMCSHWLWMRNVYLFRINFAKVFRRIRIFAHKNITSFFLTGWYFRNQILVANKSYIFTNLILHKSIAIHIDILPKIPIIFQYKFLLQIHLQWVLEEHVFYIIDTQTFISVCYQLLRRSTSILIANIQ